MDDKQSDSSKHLKFAVLAVDVVLFTYHNNELYARLISIERPPYFPKGSKGFPGGLIAPDETAEEAVLRHLSGKAGIDSNKIYIEQLYTFSGVDRDPRGRVVAVSYMALVPWQKLSDKEKDNSSTSWWSKVSEIGNLAYDHDEMLQVAVKRLRSKLTYTTLISKILPKEFSLGELEKAYSNLLGKELDKRNFRKKIIKLEILKELTEKREGKPYRPSKLFKFKHSEIDQIDIL